MKETHVVAPAVNPPFTLPVVKERNRLLLYEFIDVEKYKNSMLHLDRRQVQSLRAYRSVSNM